MSEGVTTDFVQTSVLGDAVDEGPALVFVADENGRYIAVNQTACDVLGYTRDELLGLSVADVAFTEEAPDLYRALLRRGRQVGTTQIRTKDGRLLPIRYRASEATVARMTVYVSVAFLES